MDLSNPLTLRWWRRDTDPLSKGVLDDLELDR